MAESTSKTSPDLTWGRQTAELLWEAYAARRVDFSGKRLLDFGCSWGYFCELALERGCRSATGVDLHPHWLRLENPGSIARPNLVLAHGNILELESLQAQSFDVIVSSGTLFLLESAYLDRLLGWFYDHLEPGGVALLRTRCVTAKSFNDLGTRLRVPGAQLLFSRKDIDSVLVEQGHTQLKNHLGYTGATWIFACFGAGFEVVDVQRFTNTDVVKTTENHPSKTRHIDPIEIATGEILLHLRRPDTKQDMTELRRRLE